MLLNALKLHAEGHIAKHKANVLVYMKHPAGIGDHPDIIDSMEKEILEIAKYQDVIDMINMHFSNEEQLPLFS
jgi:septum formation topological specificity factor MinE|tara:strand:+ start:236 stop:454 length:219 start_codon:yes stop_codon:yes gene_type:complete